MIESDTLTQDAIDYLNSIEKNKLLEAQQIGRVGARQELLNWCVQWFDSAKNWRKQSYEDDWLMWQRNADGRFDPAVASRKKDWQAKAFVDLTPSHRETIHAELFRLVAGSRPILDVFARAGGDAAQAENIRDLELREFEKSRFEVEYNKLLEDRTTYGSAFARFWFAVEYADRIIQVPVKEPFNPLSIGSINRHMMGQPLIIGYQPQAQKKLIYRGVRMQHINIWDFFPDPKALQIKGHPCLVRTWLDLQFILDKVSEGEFMPEAGRIMSQQASLETTPPDKSVLQSERRISDVAPRREGNQKTWEVYEMEAKIPQKWAYPLFQQPLPLDNAEKLVPCKIIFNKQTIFCVYPSKTYDGEPAILKDDYMPVAGRFYGRGIPEMLKNPQAVVNEVVCQRLDAGDLAMQEGFAVVEKAVVNTDELEAGGPGLVVRMNQKALGPDGDVRNAILPLGRPDVKNNAGFAEVHEWERIAQERTSVNRAEHGTQPLPGGARTLGGMQMLKNTASAKFAFIQMLSEFSFMYEVFRMYWQLIYANIQPQDVVDALGPERAQTFQLLSPEEIETAYKFEPKGIFERESKGEMQARLAALHEQFKGLPGLNDMAFFDLEAKSFQIDPERLKIPQAQMVFLQAQAQNMAMPLAKQMVSEIVIGQAVRDVEKNLAEKMADVADGAKQEKVSSVPDVATPDKDEKKV